MNQSLLQKVKQTFAAAFTTTPALFYSPGRINLIGEHVDYNGGFVMPAAINKGVYYAIAANGTDQINFVAADFGETYAVKVNNIQRSTGWHNYVLGVIDQLQQKGYTIDGFDCALTADLPPGSGMSSSAAVECGLAHALNIIFGFNISPINIALIGQAAEHKFPQVMCGIMDQFANMMGKKDNVLLLDCRDLSYKYFPLQLEGYDIVMLNCKVHHSLADGQYNIRRQQCEEGVHILQQTLPAVQQLRDVTPEQLATVKNSMSPLVYQRCLFITQEIQRTQQAAELLQANNLRAFGECMYETHDGLSQLYNVSCEELDFLAAFARKHPAVIGARMMGGGFGGCTINIVETTQVNDFILAAMSAYRTQFNIEGEAYVLNTADGTHPIYL